MMDTNTEAPSIKIGDRDEVYYPLPLNDSLSHLIKEFTETGKALFVVEPGDLTRYTFILVRGVDAPTWRGEVWFILPLSGMSGKVSTNVLGFMPEYVVPHDFSWMTNKHSSMFTAAWIEWFHRVLQEESGS